MNKWKHRLHLGGGNSDVRSMCSLLFFINLKPKHTHTQIMLLDYNKLKRIKLSIIKPKTEGYIGREEKPLLYKRMLSNSRNHRIRKSLFCNNNEISDSHKTPQSILKSLG